MTNEQRAAIIAEKVMGWCFCEEFPTLGAHATWLCDEPNLAVPVKDYNPDHNIAQALEALEKWVSGGTHDRRRRCQMDYLSGYKWTVELEEDRNYDPHDCVMTPLCGARAEALPEAIVSALIEAVKRA